MKKLLIFDLDGTLIDTLIDLNQSVNFALKLNGFELKDIEHTRKSIGDGVAMLVKRSLPKDVDEKTYKKVLSDFEDHYKIHSEDNTYPYKGMKEVLVSLKQKGYLLAVSTNKIEDVAVRLIEKFYPGLFDTICGDNKIRQRKPAKDSIEEICKRLSFYDKKNITYIGDTEVDALTAKNAEVKFLLVSYGYRKIDEQKALKLDVLGVDSPQKLLNFTK